MELVRITSRRRFERRYKQFNPNPKSSPLDFLRNAEALRSKSVRGGAQIGASGAQCSNYSQIYTDEFVSGGLRASSSSLGTDSQRARDEYSGQRVSPEQFRHCGAIPGIRSALQCAAGPYRLKDDLPRCKLLNSERVLRGDIPT